MKQLRALVKKYRDWELAQADARLPTLDHTQDELVVRPWKGEIITIPTNAVTRIEIYKMDLIIVDLVCMNIWTG